MASTLAIYTLVHQPRRLKLPAQPIPRGASIEDITRCLFDERMDERYFRKAARTSYYPAARMFLELARQQGVHLSIGITLSFVRQARRWEPALLDLFRELIAEEHVELIGVEPYHSFLFLIDLPMFVLRMQSMCDEMEQLFGKRPTIADTTEMCMSAPIYNALDTVGFHGALLDGRQQVFEWRASTYLYHYGDEALLPLPLPVKKSQYSPRSKRAPKKLLADDDRDYDPYLLARHTNLSDDVGFRFTNRHWDRYPLFADTYAAWIAQTPGDIVLLGWDFETFGEHHSRESGIFEFMRSLPPALAQHDVSFCTPTEFIERTVAAKSSNIYHLPLPVAATTWAGDGSIDFFLGNSAQQALFRLMSDVYNAAKITENPDLINLALWMLQSDNLHMIQWFGRSGSEADVSSYFTPREWWDLGSGAIIREQQQVYINLCHAMEPYLPARLVRRDRVKGK
jgi:alpha-amylase